MVVDGRGRPAQTRFRVLERFSSATLLAIRLETGRTHQIRVHTAWAGHPLAGDNKYGDRESEAWLRAMGLQRLFLHASSLKFHFADEETEREYVAPLPAELERVLDGLRNRP